MAVRENPYNKWLDGKSSSDYRCTDTQVNSLVKQQLSQPEYLRTSNRVNPGPLRNTRASLADSKQQVPHVLSPIEMWGWQPWTKEVKPYSDSGLNETVPIYDIPGGAYYPYDLQNGATYIDLHYSVNVSIDSGSPITITS